MENFQEVGIAAFVLGLKLYHVGEFREYWLTEVEETALRKKIKKEKTWLKYNGLQLARAEEYSHTLLTELAYI